MGQKAANKPTDDALYAYVGQAARSWLPGVGPDMEERTKRAILTLTPILSRYTNGANVYKLDRRLTEETQEPRFDTSALRLRLAEDGHCNAGLFLQKVLRADQFNAVLYYFF